MADFLKAALAAAALILLPASAPASTVTYWYLNTGLSLVGYDFRNTGYMIVDADRAGQTSWGSEPGIGDPSYSGPALFAEFSLFGGPALSWMVTFDERGDPVEWSFGSQARSWDVLTLISSRRGDRIIEDYVWPALLFYDAPPGQWFSSEWRYVAAAREAGIAPIPLPAAGWLLVGALAGLALLRRRRA